MNNLSDFELILLIRQKNSEALNELCLRYQPMIRSVIKKYFLRSYDQFDWQQDAMYICYESAILFDESYHVKFGGFFQLRFLQHARSMVRYEMAKKRAPYGNALSLETQVMPVKEMREKILEKDTYMISENTINIAELESYIENLSRTELIAFRVNLGTIKQADALEALQCTPEQLMSARDRCRRKFHDAF